MSHILDEQIYQSAKKRIDTYVDVHYDEEVDVHDDKHFHGLKKRLSVYSDGLIKKILARYHAEAGDEKASADEILHSRIAVRNIASSDITKMENKKPWSDFVYMMLHGHHYHDRLFLLHGYRTVLNREIDSLTAEYEKSLRRLHAARDIRASFF